MLTMSFLIRGEKDVLFSLSNTCIFFLYLLKVDHHVFFKFYSASYEKFFNLIIQFHFAHSTDALSLTKKHTALLSLSHLSFILDTYLHHHQITSRWQFFRGKIMSKKLLNNSRCLGCVCPNDAMTCGWVTPAGTCVQCDYECEKHVHDNDTRRLAGTVT